MKAKCSNKQSNEKHFEVFESFTGLRPCSASVAASGVMFAPRGNPILTHGCFLLKDFDKT